jgi:hypothetical protein
VRSMLRVVENSLEQRAIVVVKQLDDVWDVLRIVATPLALP